MTTDTVTLPRSVVEQALEALYNSNSLIFGKDAPAEVCKSANISVISNLTAAIEAAKQEREAEPIGEVACYGNDFHDKYAVFYAELPPVGTKLYGGTPPAPKAEPVAKVKKFHMDDRDWFEIDPLLPHDQYKNGQLLYTTPQPQVTEGLLTEVHLISEAYDRIKAERTFAVDDLEYDLFAAGWKACAALAAAPKKEGE